MKKNVIFDLDGVLLSSTEPGISTLIKAIGICGLKKPNFDDVRLIWGCRLEEELIPLLSQKLNWPDKDGSIQQVINLFLDLSHHVIYPFQTGLVPALKTLIKRGYQLGIVSNRDAKGLIWRLGQQGIKVNLFRCIQTPDHGFSKPDPRMFNHFWHALDFDPEETIYVGDSITYDLEVARCHNPPLEFVAITSGLHSCAEFLSAGVPKTHIFNGVLELTATLKNL